VQEKPYLVAFLRPAHGDPQGPDRDRRPRHGRLRRRQAAIAISPDIPDETAQVLDQSKDPGRLGDIVAATWTCRPRSGALAAVESDVAERLRRLLVLLQRKSSSSR